MKALIFGNVSVNTEEIDLDSAVNPFSQFFSDYGSMPLSRSELYNYLAARVPVKLVSELEYARRKRYPIARSQKSSWTVKV